MRLNSKSGASNLFMKKEEKERRLVQLAKSVLDNNLYKWEFSHLMRAFEVKRDEVFQAFLDYNMDIFDHGNEIYSTHTNRIVLHIHNHIAGSWHIERQKAVCNFISCSSPRSAIDLGFGVPAQYVKKLLKSRAFKLTLCDISAEAIDFGRELLKIWDPDWPEIVTFIQGDLADADLHAEKHDSYIALHSLEHVQGAGKCLERYVQNASEQARFLIELPIGPITPEHTISWDNVEEVRTWLIDRNLKIINSKQTWVNPAVDLFAEQHEFAYSGYLALCTRG